tara:strand:+ start:4950 stop:5648 length:699 start_codon:yes stop_codon:yes gene_type:complete
MDTQNTRLSFQDIINSSITNLSGGTSLTIADIILALSVSLICGLIITWVYKKSYQGVVYQTSFNLSILIVMLVTTSVIMVISGNLILSLGMVGALSIIRFRSAIKDPIDIVYMFWAVAVGIANGVANFKISIISTIFISLIIMALKDRPQRYRSYMLICNYDIKVEDEVFRQVKEETKRYKIKSKSTKDNNVELILEVIIKDETSDLPGKLSKIQSVEDCTLMSYSNNLLDQ